MESIRLQGGVPGIGAGMGGSESGCGRSNPSQVAASVSGSGQRPWQNLSSRFLSRNPLEYLWAGGGKRCNGIAVDDGVAVMVEEEMEGGRSGSWMERILQARRAVEMMKDGGVEAEGCSGCEVDYEEDDPDHDDDHDDDEKRKIGVDGEKIEFDADSFSRFLRRVNLSDAKMFAQLSYLSMLAYCIPKIKAKNLVKNRGLTYVTSSSEKRELLLLPENDQLGENGEKEIAEDRSNAYFINASVAYDIAASAAAYLHSQTKSILPFTSSNTQETKSGSHDGSCSDGDSLNAAAESVTRVISSDDQVKQSVADDLSSVTSSPCEWFICDDIRAATRYLVIQGSESLASWQANLLFEPVQFEGLDVLVHRGIYEAAKGIYEQMLPEIRSHMNSGGEHAALRFTGHSLGGSLAMLVNLMLLIRREVPKSRLLPVVTFGAPFIMCGGDKLLAKLGLPKNHVQALILHRDVVPRAFSADLPSRAVDLLKAVNGNFRNHPCLTQQNVMYSPMGQLLILQPDPRFSPPHTLLPSGSGLYLLAPAPEKSNADKNSLRSAQLAFLNSPHPLEILSDRAAYGAEGSIMRDHDMRSYLKAIRVVIRHELNQINKARWPLVSPRSRTIIGQLTSPANIFQHHGQLKFSAALYIGKKSWKRFSRLVASQHMQLFVLLLVPARLLALSFS